jgi:Porin subfamily
MGHYHRTIALGIGIGPTFMNIARGFLLGSAAGLLTVAGAQAADLPIKAKPVEYVKVCSLYGVGFYYIPGTDTCIKIGGYVRAEINFNATGTHTTPVNGPMVQYVRTADTHTWRSRFAPSFDVRNQTEYGTLRAYARMYFNHTNSADSTSVDRAFIQFAGFTFGKLTTAAVAPWEGQPGTSANRFMGADDIGSGVTGVQYTAEFGNGVTSTIALENAAYRGPGTIFNRADPINNPTATAFTTSSVGGFRFPDIVGNVKVTQAWGTAFVSAQAAQKFPTYYGATEDTGSPGSEWGYAVLAGLNLLLPSLGAGDQMWIESTYTRGILGRLQGGAPFQTYGIYGSSSAAYQSLAFGYALDAVFNATTLSDLELTTGWGFAAGIEHFWVPGRLRSSLFGSYSSVSYSDVANAWLCSQYGVASVGAPPSVTNGTFTAGSVCDFDFTTWQIGSRTIWTPVTGLDFTAEVLYTNVDTAHSGFLNTVGAASTGIKPPGLYELKDQGVVSGMLRAQRNW